MIPHDSYGSFCRCERAQTPPRTRTRTLLAAAPLGLQSAVARKSLRKGPRGRHNLVSYHISHRYHGCSCSSSLAMPSFFLATRPRSRPTTRPSSPAPFQRNRLSASAPNIPALARADPLPASCPLEIRLSSDTVVLRGTGTQTVPAQLTGSVILHLADATAVKGVGLRLLATAKVDLPLSEGCAFLIGLSLIHRSIYTS